jgi:hypothetical protein
MTAEEKRVYMRNYMRWYRSDEQVLRRLEANFSDYARILQTRSVAKRLFNKYRRQGLTTK